MYPYEDEQSQSLFLQRNGRWIFRHAAGIDVTEQNPGGRVMRISPKVNNGLKYVKAVYDSASGCYQCGWEISEDNKITVTVTVPFGGSAEVVLYMRIRSYMKIKKIHYSRRRRR